MKDHRSFSTLRVPDIDNFLVLGRAGRHEEKAMTHAETNRREGPMLEDRGPVRSGRSRRFERHGQQHSHAPGNPFGDARVSVVIPTLNEAANLPHVFARLPQGLHEVVLVDGRSVDDTVAVAKSLRPDVRIVFEKRPGKGIALAAGFAAAEGDIIVMLDADGSTDPAEIPRYVIPLLQGADFVKGSRFMPGGATDDITPIRKLGNSALNGTVNKLYGTRYTDLCYGYNAFWNYCLPVLAMGDDHGFEIETVINVRIARAGLRVVEVPSVERERLFGESKLSPVRDGLRVLRTIVRERTRPPGATFAEEG
jgi:glycosyltransferase involved in cell wall biosynthesis